MISLLYVSTSMIDPAAAESAVSEIARVSQHLNDKRGITGALIFTGTHFAQALEGDAASIEILMSALRQDPRHINMIVVEQSKIVERRFAGWSMAYAGPSQFVARQVNRLLQNPSPVDLRRSAERLMELLRQFAAK